MLGSSYQLQMYSVFCLIVVKTGQLTRSLSFILINSPVSSGCSVLLFLCGPGRLW